MKSESMAPISSMVLSLRFSTIRRWTIVLRRFTASKAIDPAVRPSASKWVTVRIVDSLEAASLIIAAVSSAVR